MTELQAEVAPAPGANPGRWEAAHRDGAGFFDPLRVVRWINSDSEATARRNDEAVDEGQPPGVATTR